MWERKSLKERAHASLKGYYWKAFIISFMLAIISGGVQATGITIDFNRENLPYQDYGGNWILPSTIIIAGTLIIVLFFLTALALQVFIFYPLQAGAFTYYKLAAEGREDLNNVSIAFQKTNYRVIIKTMVWRAVVTFLWFLALLIPGFIKTIAYCFVPFILADNPQIGHKRALQLSHQMTYGHKWDILKLLLSFLGWWILGLLALGIGIFFVLPYIHATYAQLYLTLRHVAITKGITSEQELRLVDQ
ncbi:DUF975 family protein [Paenibacillus yanchengensis]|uniref:DUF975 family protein n=1 Tax=Paenibacillus yanchengensis TaxID=2035833 RepID=A0ABW4YG70_9BACL